MTLLRLGRGRLRRAGLLGAVAVLMALVLATSSSAQLPSFSTADLEGTWRVFQLATPTGNVSAVDIRSYSGQLTFDDSGAVTIGSLTDDLGVAYTVAGTLTLSAAGLLQGTLELDDAGTPVGPLIVSEARALATKFTIVGAASVLGQVGLFTFVRLDGVQTFSLNEDVANDGDGNGNYAYHEITPSDNGAETSGDASWSTGSITFHADSGCTEADLMRADGTIRAQRSDGLNSFG